MNDHFFVILPSNSSAKYCPNNTVARFVTELPETIRLQGQYEMALVEIIYPHNWYNVSDENKDNYWFAAANKNALQKVYLSPGYYEDGNALVDALKFAQDIGVKFSFNSASGRLSLNFRSTGSHTMRMSEICIVLWDSRICLTAKSRSVQSESAILTPVANRISCTSIATLRLTP
jgi:hypothetical protein